MIAVIFSKQAASEVFEGKATICSSTVTNISLAVIHEKYSIPDEYALLYPGTGARTSSLPPKCYSIYEEHLKSKVCFPPHPLVIKVLRF